MRVLGIDPGVATCGFGVVDGSALPGGPPAVVAYGALRPPGEGVQRLGALFAAVQAVLWEHEPDVAAVELLYHNRNVRTATEVGQARGVVLLALVQAGLEVAEYTPTEVKMAVTGYGLATKEQMGAVVTARLGLPRPPRPADAADALGLCLCHLQGAGLRQRLKAAASHGSIPDA